MASRQKLDPRDLDYLTLTLERRRLSLLRKWAYNVSCDTEAPDSERAFAGELVKYLDNRLTLPESPAPVQDEIPF